MSITFFGGKSREASGAQTKTLGSRVVTAKAARARALEAQGRGWILLLVVSVLTSLTLCLSLVWLNVERTDMGYKRRHLQQEFDERLSAHEKLAVERDHLLSPEILEAKARDLGMRDARPGQNRRLE